MAALFVATKISITHKNNVPMKIIFVLKENDNEIEIDKLRIYLLINP